MTPAQQKARVLIEALPYFQAFDRKIVVVKLGGSALHESSLFTDTLVDMVFMEQVRIRPIIVHGGGPHISERLAQRNVQAQFVDGLRVTDESTLEVAEEVLGEVNRSITDEMNRKGGQAVSLQGSRDDVFRVVKRKPTPSGADLGYVGDIEEVQVEKVLRLAEAGVVPVISPLGRDASGQTYNINADTAAARLAGALKAEKLVFMSNIPGILKDEKDPESLITSLGPDQVRELIEQGVIRGGMLPKVEASLNAMDAGVNKVHIVDGRQHHSLLLEIFTPQGVGTQFVRPDHATTRLH